MNRIIRNVIVISLMFLLIGCSANPQSVSDLKKYASDHFGEYEFLREEQRKGMRTIYLRDVETDIEYYVRSSVYSDFIDNTKVGEHESTRSDFYTKYYWWIFDQGDDAFRNLQASDQYVFEFGEEEWKPYLVQLVLYSEEDVEEAKEAAKEIGKTIAKFDTRRFFETKGIDIAVPEVDEATGVTMQKTLWSYDPYTDTFQAYDKLFYERRGIELATQYVRAMLTSEAEFDHVETVPFEETGIVEEDIMTFLGDVRPIPLDEPIRYYYFNLDGEQYWVNDFCREPNTVNGFTSVRFCNFPEKYWYWAD